MFLFILNTSNHNILSLKQTVFNKITVSVMKPTEFEFPSTVSVRKHSEFEFPSTDSVCSAVPNDVVFCGKVITRRTESETRVLLRSEFSCPTNGFVAWLRSPSGRENRCRRSESFRRRYNGMFGAVMKFPLQMELSDIKMRQDRRESRPSLPPLMVTAKEDGGENSWELVRPLRRRGTFKNAFFGCLPIV